MWSEKKKSRQLQSNTYKTGGDCTIYELYVRLVVLNAFFQRSNFLLGDSTAFFFLSFFIFFIFVGDSTFIYGCGIAIVVHSIMYCVCEMGDNDMRMHNRDAEDNPARKKTCFRCGFWVHTALWRMTFKRLKRQERATNEMKRSDYINWTETHEIGKCVAIWW